MDLRMDGTPFFLFSLNVTLLNNLAIRRRIKRPRAKGTSMNVTEDQPDKHRNTRSSITKSDFSQRNKLRMPSCQTELRSNS
jgi:hypothetical protein